MTAGVSVALFSKGENGEMLLCLLPAQAGMITVVLCTCAAVRTKKSPGQQPGPFEPSRRFRRLHSVNKLQDIITEPQLNPEVGDVVAANMYFPVSGSHG
jgi:hypothetical protein